MSKRSAPAIAEITEDLVARLGRIEGLTFPAQRLPAIAARLRELHEIAAVLESIEPIEIAPASRFDPAWPMDEGQ